MRNFFFIRIINNNRKAFYHVCVFLFRIMLDYILYFFLSNEYTEYGFSSSNFSTILYCFSWLVLLIYDFIVIACISTSKGEEKTSSRIIYTLYLFCFVPFTSMIGSGELSFLFILCFMIYWLVLLLFHGMSYLHSFQYDIGRYKINRTKTADLLFIIAGFAAVLVMIISSFIVNKGFHFDFNLSNVYSYRNNAESSIINTGILGYIFSWTRSVIPIFLSYCIYKRKFFLSLVFSFAQIISFSVDGMKSVLFMLFVVIGFSFFALKNNRIEYQMLVSVGFLGLSIIAFLELLIFRSSYVAFYLFFRLFFFPVQISTWFFQFFSINEPDYYRLSFLKYFGVKSPYSYNGKGIEYLINDTFFSQYSARTNNGLFSDAITNWGIIGIIIMPFILVVVLELIERFSKNNNPLTKATVIAYVSITLLNNFLMTSLLTHGIIVICLLLFFMQEDVEHIGNKVIIDDIRKKSLV